jgi:hypothetical protein
MFDIRPVFGMLHLPPLPGAPLFGGSLEAVIEAALADARALRDGGADGMVFENYGDRPFFKDRVEARTVAAMTRVIADVTREVGLPFGVNVLRNDAASALAIAAATGASFIRVNVHTGAMLTDQGIIEGQAAETLRLRASLAPRVLIFADHMVKHATPLVADIDEEQAAKDLLLRGLADAIIVSGRETGAEPDRARFACVRAAIDGPLLVGSGLTADNAAAFEAADGAIVGTSLKRGGRVVAALVESVVAAFKWRGGR